MKCPKCKKAELKETISYKHSKLIWIGICFNVEKIFTYFCPLCDFHKEKSIKISFGEYQAELQAKKLGKIQKEANVEVEFGGFKLRSSGKEK